METKGKYEIEALKYIAKLADGGCRDSITYLDKCLAFSPDLTLENVVSALGTVDYQTMLQLSSDILTKNTKAVIYIVEALHATGKDIKQFVKQYLQFLLDVQKYGVGCDWKYLQIPKLKECEDWLEDLKPSDYNTLGDLLDDIIKLNSDIKWSSTAKYDLEAVLFRRCG